MQTQFCEQVQPIPAHAPEHAVEYRYNGPNHQEVRFHHDGMEDLEIDYSALPPEERHGAARQLLGASVLSCLLGTMGAALCARGVVFTHLSGRAEVITGESKPPRVEAIDVEIKLAASAEYDAEIAKVEKIMTRGCLISRSLAPGITVREHVVRV